MTMTSAETCLSSARSSSHELSVTAVVSAFQLLSILGPAKARPALSCILAYIQQGSDAQLAQVGHKVFWGPLHERLIHASLHKY